MNDEFLYRLRREPSSEFSQRLKKKLRRQAEKPVSASVARTLVVFAIGGSALAAALLSMTGVPSVIRNLSGEPDTLSVVTKVPTASGGVTGGLEIPSGHADRTAAPGRESRASESMPGTDRTDAAENAQAEPALQGRQSMLTSTPATEFTGVARAQSARDYISMVAPPMAHRLAMQFADILSRNKRFKAPQLHSLDTASGLRVFCQGTSVQQPDIAIASRRITAAEFDMCRRNGVESILEAKIGYQAIVLSGAKIASPLKLSARDLYLALAKQIPDPADPTQLIDNPNLTWNQVNRSLEFREIEVFGPPLDSTSREAFAEFVLEAGCDTYSWIRMLKDVDRQRYERICHTLREDGVYVEVTQNNTLVTQNLWAEPNAVAILTYSFYEKNRDDLVGSLLGGVDPTLETIAAGAYPASGSLYIYVNKARADLIPGVSQFIALYLDVRFLMREEGFIPLAERERQPVRIKPLTLNELNL